MGFVARVFREHEDGAANARHIVHCVNSHAKLVAALELIRDESHLGADYICKVASDALATLQAEEK